MRSLTLLLMTLFLQSCGKTEDHARAAEKRLLDPEAMDALVRNQSIFCSDEAFCPQGIGKLFSAPLHENKEIITCTTFLIGENLAMTNSHCIWAGKRSLEETCEGLSFAFPSRGGPSYQAKCSKILYRDPRQRGRGFYRPNDNDFALIELDQKIPVTPLKLIRGGLAPGAKVFPLVLDQSSDFHGRLTKLECEVGETRLGVALLKNCPIIKGNSGSPVLDQDQQVVGIIFASSDTLIKKPSEPLETRGSSSTKGFAATGDQIQNVLSNLRLGLAFEPRLDDVVEDPSSTNP